MTQLNEVLDKLQMLRLRDEDDDVVTLRINTPASRELIGKFEATHKVQLPGEYKELLMVSDGLDLFGVKLLAISEIIYLSKLHLLVFHEWGNGDCDCLAVEGSELLVGGVFFLRRDLETPVAISPSLSLWIESVVGEVQQIGALLHPNDYAYRNMINGVYYPIATT